MDDSVNTENKGNAMFRMFMPTRVVFGSGVLNDLHKEKMPGKKAMVVISNGKSGAGFLPRVEGQLRQLGVDTVVFNKVEAASPRKHTVEEGAAFARENGCDFVVALGGGSVIDAAKVMAMLAANPGDLWDYAMGGTGKGLVGPNRSLPVVSITTTAGTGSEVDMVGVVYNDDTQEKIGFGREDMFPVLAITDPELTLSVPPLFTAYQGFDALFHSVENYIAAIGNIMSDTYALTAIENIAAGLPVAVQDGKNLEAREKVSFGDTLSGFVMVTAAISSMHGFDTGLCGFYPELPHGAGLIMLSKAYFSHFINVHACDDRFVRLAQIMGMPEAKVPEDFITALEKLHKDCGVADLKMSDFGIDPSDMLRYVKCARATMGEVFTFDRVTLSDEDCVAIYNAAYK